MSIGHPASRVEGAAKVTGGARYSADNTPPGTLHAVLVGAPVSAGRILGVDAANALADPGVVRVLTARDMPRFGKVEGPVAVQSLPMQGDEIRHEGEPVAMVLAKTIEAAEAGKAAVKLRIEAAEPRIAGQVQRSGPPSTAAPLGADFTKGDVAAGLARAATQLQGSYVQPARHHNPIETSCTVAAWEADQLTLWDSIQANANPPVVMAAAFGIPQANVRVIAPHTGGGYGCKGYVWPHQILAAAAARIVGRPVKLQLSRADQFTGTGLQPWMVQEITLGVDQTGRLTALRHHIANATAMRDTHVEPASEASKSIYACPAIETRQYLQRVNSNLPTPLRPPVEGPGLWALESSLNELAVQLGMDPLDLRLVNYAERDPQHGKPWSSKKLREAYEEGARLYGWRERHQQPRQDGPWHIGHGMATCSMGTFRFPGSAKVRLKADGTAIVDTATNDIGTGTQTVCCQIAADELGLPLGSVTILWGDTRFTRTGPVYGSSATIGTGSAVALACRDLKAKLALHSRASPLEALRAAGLAEIEGKGDFTLPNDASCASAIGARGIGELGATAVDAAVVAAVYDAVNLRFRELPITPAKVLDGLATRHQ